MIRTFSKDDGSNLTSADMVAIATAMRELAATYSKVGLKFDAVPLVEIAMWYERKAKMLIDAAT